MHGLPPPDADSAEHGARVAAHIGGLIHAAGGALGFAEYMNAALYAPGLGYYSAGSRKFGEQGDFVTAPEISPLFARCIARQYAELDRLDTVLEFGAGSGRFAADFLVECARLGVLPERYSILEVSAELRTRQRDTFEALASPLLDRIEWLDTLPGSFEGFVFANEVLDAVPVDRFRRTEDGVEELTVVRNGSSFAWGARPATPELTGAVAAIERDIEARLAPGHESEVCLRLPAWMGSLADSMTHGVALLVDYGMSRREYYSAERERGTLRCHYRQRAHDDPFVWPGLQDITAQVDFTAVAEAGTRAGLEFAGYTTQAHLLLGCGLDGLLAEPISDERTRVLRGQQAKRLTLPEEMGERFKAIGFSKDHDAPLAAFSVRDLSDRL